MTTPERLIEVILPLDVINFSSTIATNCSFKDPNGEIHG